MKCHEVSQLLVAYLDGEVAPSERTLIQAHLAGCDACQEKQAAVSALQSRVGRSLHIIAAQADPSAKAWGRLEAKLAKGTRPSPVRRLPLIPVFEGGTAMRKGLAFAALVVAVIGLGTMVLAAPVRADVSDAVRGWLRIESNGGTVKIEGSAMDFTPLHPAYLPVGLDRLSGTGMNVQQGSESLELMYADGQRFVDITQSKATGDATLPAGREVAVSGQRATLVDGLQGTLDEPPAPPDASIAYTNAIRLTWYAGDVKVEMFSNLPEAEVLKIAESMVPAQTEEGGSPFPPPDGAGIVGQDGVPPEGSGGVIITQDDSGKPGVVESIP